MAQVDYFLKIDGIVGESTDDKHKGEIELASFSWGETQQAAGRGGAGAGKGAVEFLVYKLTDLLVSSYHTAPSPEDAYPLDEVAFKFGRIQVEYRPQDPSGKPAAAVQVGWDVKANKKV